MKKVYLLGLKKIRNMDKKENDICINDAHYRLFGDETSKILKESMPYLVKGLEHLANKMPKRNKIELLIK
jgi:hypothetical protein